MDIIHFLSVKYTFFVVYGYKVSYIEFFGILFNFFSVYLLAQDNILNWPIGNVGALLFSILFYQMQLYSEVVQQIYFLIIGFYAWWIWSLKKEDGSEKDKDPTIKSLCVKHKIYCLLTILCGTIVMGYMMSHIDTWLPKYFLNPASLPYIDAFVTVMSFLALALMSHKNIEGWYLLALVYFVLIGVNWDKGLFLMILFFIALLVIAIKGIINWNRLLISE